MGRIITLFVRLLEVACTATVLGLSVDAVRWQYRNSVPSKTAFTTFAGSWGVLTSLLGVMAAVIGPLAGIFMLFFDGLTTIFMLAGGIAYAVGLSDVDCSNPDSPGTWFNHLISGGCTRSSNEGVWYCSFWHNSDLVRRCHHAKANLAFLFISAVLSLGVAVMSVKAMKSKRKKSRQSSSSSSS